MTSTYPKVNNAEVYPIIFRWLNDDLNLLVTSNEKNEKFINACLELIHANELLLDRGGIPIRQLITYPYLQKLIEMGRKEEVKSFIEKAIKTCKDGNECDDEVIKKLEAML